jgi:hypothetical protein
MSFKIKYSNLGHPNRIWTISAIHGEVEKLASIHRTVFEKFSPGDRLVYTGNYFGGANAGVHETMNELLFFRRALLARAGVMSDDIVYLRGRQEELWRTLLQIQMTLNARRTIEWIVQSHADVDALLRAYGSSLDEAGRIAREGILSLTKWSSNLKGAIRACPGHERFYTVLRRAAFTENRTDAANNLLFVHAGVNPSIPLPEQEDSFWWHSKDFNAMPQPYSPFRSVIRGHDPEQQGVHIGDAAISIDGGCGYGGALVCATISDAGRVLELISA